jgi:hypothetical protein
MKTWKQIPEIESLSLEELELRIKFHYETYDHCKREMRPLVEENIENYLFERQIRINKGFVFTPLVVKQIERINQILIDHTAKLLAKANIINQQMLELKRSGDEFLDDYFIEATLEVRYWDENSLLELEEDENEGKSDYHKMAEILQESRLDGHVRRFLYRDTETVFQEGSGDGFQEDNMLEFHWNDEVLSAPELSHIPYFCHASHDLFCHHNYSISDIIRMNDFRNIIKVEWENEIIKK